ncbi:MAG TPA: hypothetical protein VK778_11250 [Solirubrobacteraceae bacterium]|nr:hypothetical protein [Solirubrobacteraceae bacterium]
MALLVGVVGVAPAFAEREHVFVRRFAGPGSGPDQLLEPAGVAVDEATGDVYVYDRGNDRVEYFSASGAYLGRFDGSGKWFEVVGGTEVEHSGVAAGGGGLPDEELTGRVDVAGQLAASIAVDNDPSSPSFGDVYVTAGFAEHVVDKFSASGEYLGQITAKTVGVDRESFDPIGVAVAPNGELLVSVEVEEVFDWFTDALHNVLLRSGVYVRPSGSFMEPAVVDGLGDLYLPSSFAGVYELGSDDELLRELDGDYGRVPPNGVGVEVSSGDVYVDDVSSVVRLAPMSAEEPNREIERFGGEGVLVGGEGVAVSSAAGNLVYVADASAGVVDEFGLEPPGPPTVESGSESVSRVTDESAALSAVVDPRSEPGEAATAYEFEYGPCVPAGSCAGSPYPSRVSGVLAAAYQPDAVSVEARGLLASMTYHFRVLAHNGHPAGGGHPEVAVGEERVFSTRGTGSFGLPDGREWELVSPANKRGALIEPIGEDWVIQAAKGGGAFTYAASAPTEPGAAGYDNFEQVLSTRTPDGGWHSEDISPPQEAPAKVSIGQGNEYRWFSEDLSEAVVQPFGTFTPCANSDGVGQPCLSPMASEQTAFLRTNFYDGNPDELCTSGCFTPLVTDAAEVANVPEGTVFGQRGRDGTCPPDLICGPEFEDAAPDGSWVSLYSAVALVEGGGPGAYEWSAGKPPGEQLRESRGVLLGDGSEVLSSDGHLYLQAPEGETLQLDAAQGVSEPPGKGDAVFLYASSDGSRIFFSDTKQLTTKAGGGVYACEIVQGAGGWECQLELTDLQSGVFTGMIGASEDGSYLYYHEGAQLLLEHDEASGWQQTLIATVAAADANDWSSQLDDRTSRVAPNGEWLAFMSQEPLTGYDNRDAVSGKLDEEVFLYDAARPISESVAGTVDNPLCASCDPTAARPHGVEYRTLSTLNHGLVGGYQIWEPTAWLAGSVPAWTPYTQTFGDQALHQSRYLSGDGRLLFDSSDTLVPRDVNGQEDVYEFEPVGVGSCTGSSSSGSVVFVAMDDGCVGLISSGESAQESAFLDASENGAEVFFLTSARLTVEDTEGGLSVFDAHECSAGAPCPPPGAEAPAACDSEASCRAPAAPSPATFAPSGSELFTGPGNLVQPLVTVKVKTAAEVRAEDLAGALRGCRKDKAKKRREACEKRARSRYGSKASAKKASRTRKAERAEKAAGRGRGAK